MNIQLRSASEAPMDLLLLADPSKEMIEKYLESGQCYTLEVNNETVGVYVLMPVSAGVIEIMNIAVAEKEQGKGLGKQLLAHAIEQARKQGFKQVQIGTGNSSIGQLALYQKCGFRITKIERGFFTDNYEEEIIENGIICRDMLRLVMEL
ncbi:GNAT family N-acetyltransferase [Lentibacillus sediminis]|uniref:GNAT family N-acetyltransferase n=1 Tax=Lentibacillus sediminis TaxID=1940529 RepID=UPI0018653C62|nr:GNAT family N-acetyltransferase [Lentibacillus sediminis]